MKEETNVKNKTKSTATSKTTKKTDAKIDEAKENKKTNNPEIKTKKTATSNSKVKSAKDTSKTKTNSTKSKSSNSTTASKSKKSDTVKSATEKQPNKKNATKTSSNSAKSKQSTTKKSVAKKETEEAIDIAFIENDEEIEIDEITEKEDENLLIDQKALEEKQLETIKDVIKKNKKEKKNKVNKQAKYQKILKNILIAIIETLYFLILIVGKAVTPTIEYITCLKIFIVVEMIATLIILEISYKKDKEDLFLHGIEMMFIAGCTLVYLHSFSMQYDKINIVGISIIGIISIYYLIKSIIIAAKKDKNK